MRRFVSELETRRLVLLCGVAALLMRFPGLMWPIKPDEAGYTLVARHWDPQPDSLFGSFWVDRPPVLIWLYEASDSLGGPMFIRLIAAICCLLLVLVAGRCAFLLSGDRSARWTAAVTAAVVANPMIDGIAAKGEVLGIPLIVGSFWLALEALRVLETSRPQAMLYAAGAGLLGTLTLGLKQNMASGLAFGGFLLLSSAVLRRISWADFWRMAIPALTGAAIPVAAVVGWCLAVGVHLDTLWYAVFGFRGDAVEVISSEDGSAPAQRALILIAVAAGTGIALLMGWLLLNAKEAWQTQPAATVAAIAVGTVDTVGLVLGASFWRPYMFGLIPAAVLAIALLAGGDGRAGRVARRIALLAVASSVVSMLAWVGSNLFAVKPPTEVYSGQAIADVSEPGDTIVVYGGRADLVMASGLDSPYEHLWSLTMRTRDPELDELTRILSGEDAPTWFVEWVDLDAWKGVVDPEMAAVLAERYEVVGEVCDEHPVWLLKGAEREAPEPDCDRPWGFGNDFGGE